VAFVGLDRGDHVDQDAVWGGDDEVSLAERFGADREQCAQFAVSDQPLVLGVDVVDLEVD
jgi:hypothetical protein